MVLTNNVLAQKGYLVLIGGAEDRDYDKTILTRTIALNNAKHIAIVPTATSDPRKAGQDYTSVFQDLGIEMVDVLDIRSRQEVDRQHHLDVIAAADLIFFTGGDQVRLVEVLKETKLLEAIHQRYASGLTIAGTSAGAAAASDQMIYARSSLDYADDDYGFYKHSIAHTAGFGFLAGITVDTHFLGRHRTPRLIQFLCSGLSSRGVGLDEDSGIIVAPDETFEVIGSSIVTVLSSDHVSYTNYEGVERRALLEVDGVKLSYLTEGTVFDLKQWKVLPERKRQEKKKEKGGKVMEDFSYRTVYAYKGPSYYLNTRALVFNLYLDPEGNNVSYYEPAIVAKLPNLEGKFEGRVADVFVQVLMEIQRMDIDLYLHKYAVSRDADEYVIAVEYFDEYVTEDCVKFVCEWFEAMNCKDDSFDFEGGFEKLQQTFDRTLYGGPTIYSLIEGGLKRGIPVNYLYEENEFQWGYGKKQVRGRSTTVNVDSIKDTEFTMFKDMVAGFLSMCGFPTPQGKNCYTAEDAITQAEALGFPLVVKPVAGHKGQGVVTGIESMDGVKKAFQNIVNAAQEEGASFEGALVQQQIYGTDHRLLAVGGKFAAALERVPAYVDGNGKDTIERLIEIDNDTEIRLDNARSPLCKIKIDEDLKDYLKLQDLSIASVPQKGERIFLRRVANISAGGVSINVTDKIHPKNVKLVEDIAKFFKVSCMGIDVLAKDISEPWDEGAFGIIEINAGPGVFMHLAPAIGGSIDVPGMIIRTHFPQEGSERIPIIAGNNLSLSFCNALYAKLKEFQPDIEFGSFTDEGMYFNGEYFFKHKYHDKNVQIILRNPKLDFAVFNHRKDDIFDYGTYHEGADMVILDNPHYAEEMLKGHEFIKDGYVIEIGEDTITISKEDEVKDTHIFEDPEQKEQVLMNAIDPFLKELSEKYR